MCGIVGLLLGDSEAHVAGQLYDGLVVLQHRGQDAAGISTIDQSGKFHLRKDNGLVRDVFVSEHVMELTGNVGIGHCRYPTAGSSSSAEAQPFYTNAPYGIALAHNGNLTNANELRRELAADLRHTNTNSDSEVLLSLLASALLAGGKQVPEPADMFAAVTAINRRCTGGFATLALVNGPGGGLLAFRDPYGIRPLVIGRRQSETVTAAAAVEVAVAGEGEGEEGKEAVDGGLQGAAGGCYDYIVASESVAIDTLGFTLLRDVAPGEAVFIARDGTVTTAQCAPGAARLSPCIFEYVYFARPDSVLDGISVYESRLAMGNTLAARILRLRPDHDIDVVIPIPDTSRSSALQVATTLGVPYREGFIKNRYIARTFIMPGQAQRKKTVRRKLNTIRVEFSGKNVLLVDDSIVRGTTSMQLVRMARDAGAAKVYFASAAPAIRFPNIYGIDMPTASELIAHGRSDDEVAAAIGADWLVYQDLEDLEAAIQIVDPTAAPLAFDTSCFSGRYVTGCVDEQYFSDLHAVRNDGSMTVTNKKFAGAVDVQGGMIRNL